jgi:hypothetical protein
MVLARRTALALLALPALAGRLDAQDSWVAALEEHEPA